MNIISKNSEIKKLAKKWAIPYKIKKEWKSYIIYFTWWNVNKLWDWEQKNYIKITPNTSEYEVNLIYEDNKNNINKINIINY